MKMAPLCQPQTLFHITVKVIAKWLHKFVKTNSDHNAILEAHDQLVQHLPAIARTRLLFQLLKENGESNIANILRMGLYTDTHSLVLGQYGELADLTATQIQDMFLVLLEGVSGVRVFHMIAVSRDLSFAWKIWVNKLCSKLTVVCDLTLPLCSNNILRLLSRLPTLKTFHCLHGPRECKITGAGIYSLCNGEIKNSLTHIIMDAPNVSVRSIRCLLRELPQLTWCHFGADNTSVMRAVEQMYKHDPQLSLNLKNIVLHGTVTKERTKVLEYCFPNLKEMTLLFNKSDNYENLENNISWSIVLNRVQSLSIGGICRHQTNEEDHVEMLTISNLASILQQTTNLRHFHLSGGCVTVQLNIPALLKICPLLESLELEEVSVVYTESYPPQRLHYQLSKLKLWHCDNLDSETVNAIMKLPYLSSFIMDQTNCNIGDRINLRNLYSSKELRELMLGRSNITVEDVEDLILNCPALTDLTISSWDSLDEHKVTEMMQRIRKKNQDITLKVEVDKLHELVYEQ